MIAPSTRRLVLAPALLVLVPSCRGGRDDGGAACATTNDTTTTTTTTADGPITATTGSTSTTGSRTTTGGPTTATSTATTESSSGGVEPPACDGVFPRAWIDGSACGDEPLVQVHHYDADTVILRQSLCTSFEGPFLYMLFGEDQVLLEDTGDGGIPIDDVVYGIIDEWLVAHGRASIELIVVNSHAHGDHVQGNPLFEGQPDTVVVDSAVARTQALAVEAPRGYVGGPVVVVHHVDDHRNAVLVGLVDEAFLQRVVGC